MSNEFGKGEGEFRVIGPPGCGKTYAATEIARESAKEYGFDKVMITSFTNAAASEIAGRADLPKENIGTLHHFGRRILHEAGDTRRLYDRTDFLKKFNAEHPRYAITRRRRTDDDEVSGKALLESRDRLLGRMMPQEMWPKEVLRFNAIWEEAKRIERVMDFQDMMDAAYSADSAPGDPEVVIADEAQDLSKQQMAIVRKWGQNARRLFVVGDDDQTIFRWRAASSEAMMTPKLEPWRYKFLSQSYRVPRAVHAAAMRWISQINPEHRLHKEYRPRDVAGVVRPMPFVNRDPEPLVVDALRQIKAGRDVMFIGTCGYMLSDLIAMLCQGGIPFANKYTAKDDDGEDRVWNPLRADTELMRGVLAFLTGIDHPRGVPEPRRWTAAELLTWADCLKGLARDWKGKHELLTDMDGVKLPDNVITTERTLETVVGFKTVDGERMIDKLFDAMCSTSGSPLAFFTENLKKGHTSRLESLGDMSKIQFIENIIERSGAKALMEPPKITVGTIHSVKGGEASVVYLLQDLSPVQMEEWDEEAGREDLIRLFYVAMTRAKEELVVVDPINSQCAVDLLGL